MSESRAWVNKFLFTRGLFTGPNGVPLYLYHITHEEHAELPVILKENLRDRDSPTFSVYWSALFCLYVSEKYRRDYDGSDISWSWRSFEQPLGFSLPSQAHSEVVRDGLGYWQRPVRRRATGYDYLGSLFDEGGLPWKLIQSENHGFGRAVRAGLSNYYKVKQFNGDLVSTVERYAQYFPQSFRTTDKYHLIASVVEWLMGLAEQHPIARVDNPAEYLDQHDDGWRTGSPLPVGEENARRLINQWLIDAGKSREEKKRLEADQKNFTCEHLLKGSFTSWSIETEVYLPAEIDIETQNQAINSTRLEIVFYEGDAPLTRAGIVHGKVSDDRSRITVKINCRAISVARRQPELPLTVQLLSNGQCVHACYFENSELDFTRLPMIFVEIDDQLKLVSTTSTVISSEIAIVRMPPGLDLEGQVKPSVLEVDQYGQPWIEIRNDALMVGQDARVALRFDAKAIANKPSLAGTVALYSTLPNLAYRGWPQVRNEGADFERYRLTANGVPIEQGTQTNRIGSFAFTVENEAGDTLLRRKIGVIPQDLRVLSVPASSSNSAKVVLKSSRDFIAELDDELIEGSAQKTDEGTTITIEPSRRVELPDRVKVAIHDANATGEPVILRLPFPKTGVRLFNELGHEVKGSMVSLDQLIEMSMTLTPRPNAREDFFVCLELICPGAPNFRRYYPFTATSQAQQVSLFSFQEDIQQMLGTTTNQDAFVRIRVETDQILKTIDIVRYNAWLKGPDEMGRLEVETDSYMDADTCVRVCGMRLDDPGAASAEVPQRASQGVAMGVFEIPSKMMKNGPWLLFSPEESPAKFRPTIWATEEQVDSSPFSPDTLHSAAKYFHPAHNPEAFDNVIGDMASDLGHSGWEYLRVLKNNYHDLPLSAFESWQALARNDSTLAAAVFRLELDATFCRRMSNELAVIWECITAPTWIHARRLQASSLAQQGIVESLAEKLLDDRMNTVSSCIPCFLHLQTYLKVPEHANLKQLPFALAQTWFDDLRRNHADDSRWPEWFADELTTWIHEQSFPQEIKQLPGVRFSRAVVYMPVFMAAVTAGITEFSSLTERLSELRFAVRVLSDFDRDGWYEPVYSLVLSNLLLQTDK